MDYSREKYDLVFNDEYVFYKLTINKHCQFDEFVVEIEKNIRDCKSFHGIIALMDSFSSRMMLPKTKFRYINIKDRHDVFEFKKDNIRVYVIKGKRDITIAMGGYKNEQKKDIERLGRNLRDYPIEK